MPKIVPFARGSAPMFAALLGFTMLAASFNSVLGAGSAPVTEVTPTVSCEQPTNSIAVPLPKSEADMISLINQWVAYKEALSQMETWWRERSEQPDALAIKPVSPATKDVISQMETWWQYRTDLRPAMTATPQRPHRHKRHYAAPATTSDEEP